MAAEIERKFLVTSDAWRHGAERSQVIRQGYFGGTPRASVRVRATDDAAWLNIKSATLGIERHEYEYPVPLSDAEEMLAHLCEGPLIEKTRHHVQYAGHTWEVDEFFGDNAGLVVAELELEHADEPYTAPEWLGAEVSDDPRYYNVSLVRHPYREWS